MPGYILIWLLSGYFNGTYDKPYKFSKIFRGIAAGTIVILVAYALLPENLRFSRAIILLGSVWAILVMGFTMLGLGAVMVGLVFVIPMLGHASWYAYKDLIAAAPATGVSG